MIGQILLYSGAGVILIWGIAHLVPTKTIVDDFGEISKDNRRIVTAGWIAEGVTMIFVSLQVFFTTFWGDSHLEVSIYLLSASLLIVLGIISFFTIAKTSILHMKLCPFIKGLAAALIILGSIW
ncbi:MAG: hypothetical protein JEZ06_01610 [Anaerolineaceae bacterium]|nr:hypothetical protein [Anaerolineaceae bacterium]